MDCIFNLLTDSYAKFISNFNMMKINMPIMRLCDIFKSLAWSNPIKFLLLDKMSTKGY